MQNYSIGGNEVPIDANEAFADIPRNRTLLVQKLTDKPAIKPEVLEGLTTIDDVFGHFKPQVSMEFETTEGVTKKEDLRFKGLSDFGLNGIINQSAFLQENKNQKDEYEKIIKQLKSNKVLRSVIADPEKKKAFLYAIHIMIKELNDTNLK